jgi:hypothetical protein
VVVDGWKRAWICANLDLGVVAWWLTVGNELGFADLGLGLSIRAWVSRSRPGFADTGLGLPISTWAWVCADLGVVVESWV